MQRIRVRYTKEGRTRFVSARDLTAVWQRALRRADLPIAYSEGFHPHPKVSFPDALPVGVASTGEYAELHFAAPIDPGPAMAALSATMPDGMSILSFQLVEDGAPKLARALEATLWEVEHTASDDAGAAVAVLDALAHAVLASDTAPVTHVRPDGDERTVDLRPAIIDLRATQRPASPHADGAAAPILRAIIRNDGPAVRPGDLRAALLAHATPDDPLPEPRLLRRVAQGRPVAGGLAEALTGEHLPVVAEQQPRSPVGVAP